MEAEREDEQAAAAAAAGMLPNAPVRRSSRAAARSAQQRLSAAAKEQVASGSETSESSADQPSNSDGATDSSSDCSDDVDDAASEPEQAKRAQAASAQQPRKRQRMSSTQQQQQQNPAEQKQVKRQRPDVTQAHAEQASATAWAIESGQQQQQHRAACDAAVYGMDDDDWQLQQALQLSLLQGVPDGSGAAAAAVSVGHNGTGLHSSVAAGTAQQLRKDRGVVDANAVVDISDDPESDHPSLQPAEAEENAKQPAQLSSKGRRSTGKQQQGLKQASGSSTDAHQGGQQQQQEEESEALIKDQPASKGKGRSNSKASSKPRSKTAAAAKKGSSKAVPEVSYKQEDLFDLFAMFEPGQNGVISRDHLVRQMSKLDMPTEGDVVDRMIRYAKDVALKARDGAGSICGSMQLDYQEFYSFVLLSQQMR